MPRLNLLSATEAARQLAQRQVTSEALVRACLERIAEREPVVGAWSHLDADAALKRARALDAGPVRGMLHGLPVAVKDLIDTVDMPATYGSPIYANHRPAWDAPCVALTRAAGGVVMGKTVTTELATFHPGKTANPHNPQHTPGGSSSGSAAAVADGMVPLALGSQTAGSIIRPAAYCGIIGYKPTFGLINRVGVKALCETLDTIGALSRTVADAALLVTAVTGRKDLLFDQSLAAPPRIGVCRTYEWKQAQPESQQALESAAQRLARGGAGVREAKLPPTFANLVAAQIDIMGFELAISLSHERLAHWDQLSAKLKEMVEAGLKVTHERYDAALALARNCRRTLAEVFTDCDVVLAPSTKGEAPKGLDATGDPLFNRMWTLLHVPCVHVPSGTGPNGLPVGVQVIGPIGGDRETLACADWIHAQLR